jgi:hypothetical protein
MIALVCGEFRVSLVNESVYHRDFCIQVDYGKDESFIFACEERESLLVWLQAFKRIEKINGKSIRIPRHIDPSGRIISDAELSSIQKKMIACMDTVKNVENNTHSLFSRLPRLYECAQSVRTDLLKRVVDEVERDRDSLHIMLENALRDSEKQREENERLRKVANGKSLQFLQRSNGGSDMFNLTAGVASAEMQQLRRRNAFLSQEMRIYQRRNLLVDGIRLEEYKTSRSKWKPRRLSVYKDRDDWRIRWGDAETQKYTYDFNVRGIILFMKI